MWVSVVCVKRSETNQRVLRSCCPQSPLIQSQLMFENTTGQQWGRREAPLELRTAVAGVGVVQTHFNTFQVVLRCCSEFLATRTVPQTSELPVSSREKI